MSVWNERAGAASVFKLYVGGERVGDEDVVSLVGEARIDGLMVGRLVTMFGDEVVAAAYASLRYCPLELVWRGI
jgi:hypothetical protein